jgi:sterol desaturase/sphingolipid hydroxylase (fatty acid hydroxylase superfamily)
MRADLSGLFFLEINRYRKRGLYSILAIYLIYAYFVYVPSLFLYILSYIPPLSVYQSYVLLSFLVHITVFSIIHSLIFLAYKLNHPKIEAWKINKEPWPWETDANFPALAKAAILTSLFNNFCLVLPLLIIFGLRARYKTAIEDFPSLTTNAWQVVFFMLVEDFLFYLTHRILHLPQFYQKFHKKHHEFKVTVSIASEYSTPVEFVLGNLMPVAVGPVLLRSLGVHIVTWLMFVSFRLIHSAEGHSGYLVPWSPFRFLPLGASAKFHDDHHLKNRGNFGSIFMIWDTVFGTNQEAREKSE